MRILDIIQHDVFIRQLFEPDLLVIGRGEGFYQQFVAIFGKFVIPGFFAQRRDFLSQFVLRLQVGGHLRRNFDEIPFAFHQRGLGALEHFFHFGIVGVLLFERLHAAECILLAAPHRFFAAALASHFFLKFTQIVFGLPNQLFFARCQCRGRAQNADTDGDRAGQPL